MPHSKKLLYIFLLFFSLLFSVSLQAQPSIIDSLKNVYNNYHNEDTTKVRLLQQIGFAYRSQSPDSVFSYADKTLNLAFKINDSVGIALAYDLRSLAFYLIGKVDSAMTNLQNTLAIYTKLNDLSGRASTLNNIGILYYESNNNNEAIAYYLDALKIREELNNEKSIAECYNNLGNVYNKVGDYATALSYSFKALKIREKYGNLYDIADSYANISALYLTIKNYEEAYQFALKAKRYFIELNSLDGIIYSYINIGCINIEMDKFDDAYANLTKGLNLCKKSGFQMYYSLIYYNIGNTYLKQKEYEKAKLYIDSALTVYDSQFNHEIVYRCYSDMGHIARIEKDLSLSEKYLMKAKELAERNGDSKIGINIIKELALLMEQKGDFKQAYFYSKLAYDKNEQINESILNNGVYDMKLNYLMENYNQKLAILEKEESLRSADIKFQRLLLISFAVVLLLFVGIIIIQKKNVNKLRKAHQLILKQSNEISNKAEELRQINTTKDKILSLLSHDIRGPIQSLVIFMDMLNSDMLSPDEFNIYKKKFITNLTNTNAMLNNLLAWSKSNFEKIKHDNKSTVSIANVVNDVVDILSQNIQEKNIKIQKHITDNSVVSADYDQLQIIFRNILANAIKFTPNEGIIAFSAIKNNDTWEVSVKDSGMGMSEAKVNELNSEALIKSDIGTNGERGTGFGWMIIKEFVAANKGTFKIESKIGEGTCITIVLPIASGS